MAAIYRNGIMYSSGGFDPSVLDDYVTTTYLTTNYYSKSSTYTKTEVDSLLSAISSFDVEIYPSLLVIDNPNTHTLYLIPGTSETKNLYTEYIYLYDESTQTGDFEKIGSQTLDLSYTNASLPGVTTVSGALDALVSRTDKYFVLSGSKATDSSTLTISDSRLTANSICTVYTDDSNLMYTSIVPASGSVTITFDSYTHASAIAVKVVVVNP